MTNFEKNAKYTFEEKLSYLSQNGYSYPNLQTLSHHGFDVIMASKIMKGVTYYFYKDKRLVKMRHWNWKDIITDYAKRYIDQELMKGGDE